MMKTKFSCIILIITVLICTFGACAEASPATTTTVTTTTEEPLFEIRRPSAAQDTLFRMERITEGHETTDYVYTGQDSFDDLIAYIDNPVFKPFIIRVSITGEEAGVSAYITEVHCKIEEIYYAPSKMNLQVGDTNITITEKRGIENGKMWYYKGDLPTLDCYDYYLIGYFKNIQEQYDFDLIWQPIPVVDCYEQYEETMNYYGFDIMDIASIYSNGVPRLKNFIAGSKQWFENEDNLRILKDRLADEDENDLYWDNIGIADNNSLVPVALADQVKPDDSIYDIIQVLGNPHEIIRYSKQNALIYYLNEDGSQNLFVSYDFITNSILTIQRDYPATLSLDQSIAETVSIGMTYDEVVQVMGAPYMTVNSSTEYASSWMQYYLSDELWITFCLDYTQDEPVVTSIEFD